MKAHQNSTSRHTAKTVGQPCLARNAEEHVDELHIGIDEVLGMRVGCWRAPVYLSPSLPSENQRTAHRRIVRFLNRDRRSTPRRLDRSEIGPLPQGLRPYRGFPATNQQAATVRANEPSPATIPDSAPGAFLPLDSCCT